MRQFFAILLLFCALCGTLIKAQAARRPGIMRPVPLAMLPDAQNTSAVRGAWRVDPQSKKVGLLFTREANGTRNLWKATTGVDSEWPVEPLTNFTAPLWADQAHVSRDGRTIICVTNSFGDEKTTQIARFNEKTGQLEALTRDATSSHSPSLSPDGKSLVFVRDLGGLSTIFLLSLQEKNPTITTRRVIEGRHPVWLDNNTLIFSDARKKGLYRLPLPADWSPLQIIKTKPQGLSLQGGEVSVVPDGSQLCIAPHIDRNGEQNEDRNSDLAPLFFMAPNGSGERALRNTDGARAPRFAPDGTALLFDAPLTPNGPRTLWVMNLAPIVPTVELTRIIAEKTALSIIGTVFCEDSPEVLVKLEAGQGAAPEKWQTIALPKAPLQKESLAQWPLPDGTTGEWTLRLTATSPDGDAAQTSMSLTLPLRVGSTITNASSDVSIFVSPVSGAAGIIGTHGIGSQVIPGEWINGEFVPRGPKNFPEKHHTTVPNPSLSNPALVNSTPFNQNTFVRPEPSKEPSTVPPVALPLPPFTPPLETRSPAKDDLFGGPLKNLPLPALPPPPSQKNATTVNTPPVAPLVAPATVPVVTPPVVTPPVVSPPASSVLPIESGTAGPLNLTNPPVRHKDSPGAPSKTLGGPKEKLPSKTVTTPATKTAVEMRPDDFGHINIDVPDDLKSGSDSNVTCLLRNTGQSVWSSSGNNPVRLLVRWFDGETGQRFRWEIKWLPDDIKPGGSLPLAFTLTPPRAGKLRLNLTVVRLPGGKYQPSSTSDKDGLDKLAEKNFRVTVE